MAVYGSLIDNRIYSSDVDEDEYYLHTGQQMVGCNQNFTGKTAKAQLSLPLKIKKNHIFKHLLLSVLSKLASLLVSEK